jgi:NAD(P)-dependent dehydrogenase (short-subunit alcohol dehydrogenase family)
MTGLLTDVLDGKTVLVTGASKGIGAATVSALAEAGASVVAHYGSDEAGALEATAAIPGDRRLLVQADLAEPDGARHLWDAALGWRERIDVLVNNAAIMEPTPFEASDEEWRTGWLRTFQVNVLSPATLTRYAVEHFLERRAGVLIALSSWVAQRAPGNPSFVAYASSKSAIRTLTQTVARHHAKDGVLAYVIAPGVVRTRMSESTAARVGGEEALSAGLAMGEWVPPEEVAALVVFLASGRSRHLSGATLDVNGATYIR